jgi:uncharacterized membrane protein
MEILDGGMLVGCMLLAASVLVWVAGCLVCAYVRPERVFFGRSVF